MPFLQILTRTLRGDQSDWRQHFRISTPNPLQQDMVVLETQEVNGLGIVVAEPGGEQIILKVSESYRALDGGGLNLEKYSYEVRIVSDQPCKVRFSDLTRHRLGALPASLSEHTPPASRSNVRHPFGGNPATAG